ncbi:hypothetical protein NLJ89_g4709 [Agrocybe chaxingu]|uniref:F-box domain-containing protein n=1 Tax=Agrocybe chaxingu TaxID=84603 RepID=A0A9W8K2K1_9AGAR|nr:hypothetical protein NLJ89_g4709 [Agrocybe chaxingu]
MMASSEDSPFASHMGTNYVPTDTEVLKIHGYLKDPKKEKAKLDDEIAGIQSTLDALKAKSDAIGATVKAHEALISPIRRYPDILQEIFVHCLPTDHDAVMSASEAPLLLTRVCSDWRRLALATPFLWSSLFVTLPGPPLRIFDEDSEIERHRAERFLRRLKTIATAAGEWLGRSGGCPLSISMVADSAQMPDGHSDNVAGFRIQYTHHIRPPSNVASHDINRWPHVTTTHIVIFIDTAQSYEAVRPRRQHQRPASIRVGLEDQRKQRLAEEEAEEKEKARSKAEAKEKARREKEGAERRVKEAEERKRKEEEAEKEHIWKEEEKEKENEHLKASRSRRCLNGGRRKRKLSTSHRRRRRRNQKNS